MEIITDTINTSPSPSFSSFNATTTTNNNNTPLSNNHNILLFEKLIVKGKKSEEGGVLPKKESNENNNKNCTCEYISRDFNNDTFTVCHFPFNDNNATTTTKKCLDVENEANAPTLYSNQSKEKHHTEYFIIFCLLLIIFLNVMILLNGKKKGGDDGNSNSNSCLFPRQFHKLSPECPVYKVKNMTTTTQNSLPSVSINPNSLIRETRDEST